MTDSDAAQPRELPTETEDVAREAPAADTDASEDDDQVLVNEADLQDDDLSEMGTWILHTLQKKQPDAEITMGSVQALTGILDGLTSAILEEAKLISRGGEGGAEAPVPPSSTGAALTSLDIHKALKRLLPGEPGDPLRPYLPSVTKQAWHMDKQSLKGVKRRKVGPGAAMAPPAAKPAAPADEDKHENVPPQS